MHQVIFEPGVYQEKRRTEEGKGEEGCSLIFSSSLFFFFFSLISEERENVEKKKKRKRLIREKERGEILFYAVEVFFLSGAQFIMRKVKLHPLPSSYFFFLSSLSSISFFILAPRNVCVLLSQESELHVWFSKKESREERGEEKNVSSDERWGKIDTKM